MKTLIGGVVAALLGLIGIAVWWCHFLVVLAGTIPVMLLLGGALAIYLGYDELKDSWNKDEVEQAPATSSDPSGDDAEKYKNEIDELKQGIEQLKKE